MRKVEGGMRKERRGVEGRREGGKEGGREGGRWKKKGRREKGEKEQREESHNIHSRQEHIAE